MKPHIFFTQSKDSRFVLHYLRELTLDQDLAHSQYAWEKQRLQTKTVSAFTVTAQRIRTWAEPCLNKSTSSDNICIAELSAVAAAVRERHLQILRWIMFSWLLSVQGLHLINLHSVLELKVWGHAAGHGYCSTWSFESQDKYMKTQFSSTDRQSCGVESVGAALCLMKTIVLVFSCSVVLWFCSYVVM